MSPLAEKLVAILEDRDRLTATLAECRRQEAAKDETIASLQQTITSLQDSLAKQTEEIQDLKTEMDELDDQIESVLLSSADPEDAKLKNRVDAVFAAIATRSGQATAPTGGNGQPQQQQVRVSVASAASQIGATASPAAARPAEAAVSATASQAQPSRVNGNPIIPVATAIRVARSATPSPRPLRDEI
jgi:septal ring factor EnvC (AmiA/AmiB activator)